MVLAGFSYCSFKLTFYRSAGMKFCYLCRVKLDVQRIAKIKSFCKHSVFPEICVL